MESKGLKSNVFLHDGNLCLLMIIFPEWKQEKNNKVEIDLLMLQLGMYMITYHKGFYGFLIQKKKITKSISSYYDFRQKLVITLKTEFPLRHERR